jgi:hypothetical protein
MNGHWKYIYASVQGTSHQRVQMPCQDVSRCEVLWSPSGESILLATISDGAGSAAHAEIGAQLACDSFAFYASAFIARGGAIDNIDRVLVRQWLSVISEAIRAQAQADDRNVRDYACTLAAALIGSSSSIYVQVGDGGMVVAEQECSSEYCWIFWPESGEYLNETRFLTDKNVLDRFEFDYSNRPIAKFAAFSDGLQSLALHFASQSAHREFFGPMFSALDSEEPGFSLRQSDALADFLRSERINARTDDDRSLILASQPRLESTPLDSQNDS